MNDTCPAQIHAPSEATGFIPVPGDGDDPSAVRLYPGAMLIVALFLAAHAQVMVAAEGLSAKHPADAGIEKDPAVLFAENFESGDMKKWDLRDPELKGQMKFVLAEPHALGVDVEITGSASIQRPRIDMRHQFLEFKKSVGRLAKRRNSGRVSGVN